MFKHKNFIVKQVGQATEIITKEGKEATYLHDIPQDNPFGAVSKGSPAVAKEGYNKYTVSITDSEINITYEFNFSDSIYNWKQGINELDTDALTHAFYCVLSDALAGVQHEDAVDFIEAFGYEDLQKGKKVYYACADTAEQLQSKFGIDEDSLCDLLNELQEEYDI